MADQFWYTWARRGPGGRSGFQFVAASRPLADRSEPMTQAALRYCRSPGEPADPAGTSAVSFGWADDGPWRVVFNRVPAGRDSIGRPGVFCAHVIVGQAAELPTRRVVTWFGSPLWWTSNEGGWDDGPGSWQLGTLEPEDFGAGDIAEPDKALLSAFLEALLIRGSRQLQIPVLPAQLASLAAGAEQAVPGILEGTSLSTCESNRHAGAFDVVGLTAARRVSYGGSRWDEHLGEDAAASRAARAIVAGALSDQQRELAFSVARIGEGIEKQQFVIAADALLAVESGSLVAFADLPSTLLSPSALSSILRLPAGFQLAARALADGSDDAWEAIEQSVSGLSRPLLTKLGSALGGMVADNDHVGRIGGYLRRAERTAPHMKQAVAAAVVAACTAQPSLFTAIDDDGRLQLLRQAHRSGDEVAGRALVEHCGTADWPIVQAEDLPADWRGAAAARFVNSGRRTSYLVGLLSTDEYLARSMLQHVPSPAPLIALVGQCALDQACAIALNLGPDLLYPERLTMMAAVSDRLPAERKVQFIVQYLELPGPSPSAWGGTDLAHLASLAVAGAVITRSRRLYTNVSLTGKELALLRRVGGPRHEAWSAIGESIRLDCNPADVVHATKSAFANFDHTEQIAAEEVALKFVMALCHTREQIGKLADELLNAAEPDYGACCTRLALCAFRAIEADRTTAPARAVLEYIASLIAQKRIKINSRAVSDDELRGMLRQLVATLPQPEKDLVSDSMATASKPIKQWWAALSQPDSGHTITVSLPNFRRSGQGKSSAGT